MALSEEKRKKYEDFFRAADADNSGSVSKLELAKIIRQKSGEQKSLDEIVVGILILDSNMRTCMQVSTCIWMSWIQLPLHKWHYSDSTFMFKYN